MRESTKLWVLLILLILAINSTLFIFASGLTDGYSLGKVLGGDIDYPTYLTKMKIGYEGGWQYINRYTSEPHSPSYIFMFYILLGHLARVLGLNLHFAFHAARFILAFFALQALYAFIKKYAGEAKPLPLFLLSLFISGSYLRKIDIAPQYHLYAAIMGFTHFMLTLLCLLVFFDCCLEYTETRSKRDLWKALLTLQVLALIHPFMVVLAGLVITGTVILMRKFRKAFPALALAALSVSPAMLYFFHVFRTNPVLAGWREQAVVDVPVIVNFFLYGPGSLFAYFALLLAVRGKIKMGGPGLLFPVWFLAGLALSLTNLISSHLQWFFFASIPVAVLVYKFLQYLEENANFKVLLMGRSVVAWLLVLLLVTPTFNNLYLLNRAAFNMVRDRDTHNERFISIEDMRCYEWLKTQARPDEVILARPQIGNLVPVFTNSLTFIGHAHETIDYKQKLEKTEDFFDQRLTDREAAELLPSWRISYVLKLNKDPAGYSFLKPVLTGRTISLYKVEE